MTEMNDDPLGEQAREMSENLRRDALIEPLTTIWPGENTAYKALVKNPVGPRDAELIAVSEDLPSLVTLSHDLGLGRPDMSKLNDPRMETYDEALSYTAAQRGIRFAQIEDLRAKARTQAELDLVNEMHDMIASDPNVEEALERALHTGEDPPDATATVDPPAPRPSSGDSGAEVDQTASEDPPQASAGPEPTGLGDMSEAPHPGTQEHRQQYAEERLAYADRIQNAVKPPDMSDAEWAAGAEARNVMAIAMRGFPTAGYAVEHGSPRAGRRSAPSSRPSPAQEKRLEENKGKTLKPRGR